MADLEKNEMLREQSKKGYVSRTNLIMKRLGFKDAAEMFEHPDKIIESIDSTYSNWNSLEDLETYRKSELFRTTWDKVKPLFSSSPMAFSMEKSDFKMT